MNIIKTVREIGFFETCANLAAVADSCEVLEKAGEAMPLPIPPVDIDTAAVWLKGFGKEKYLFLNPEIGVADRLATLHPQGEAVFLVPCDMEPEVQKRLEENLPSEMQVSLLKEPFFPERFYPQNGLMIASGYLAGGRFMVLPETYRMIEHYKGFFGKKAFLPYVELEAPVRYDGWMEAAGNAFTEVWRNEYD